MIEKLGTRTSCDGCGAEVHPDTKLTKLRPNGISFLRLGHWCEKCANPELAAKKRREAAEKAADEQKEADEKAAAEKKAAEDAAAAKAAK